MRQMGVLIRKYFGIHHCSRAPRHYGICHDFHVKDDEPETDEINLTSTKLIK